MIGYWEILIIALIVGCPVIGGWLGSRRGCTLLGVLLGLFLGPIGWIIILLVPHKKV
jgi:hypothetical protein